MRCDLLEKLDGSFVLSLEVVRGKGVALRSKEVGHLEGVVHVVRSADELGFGGTLGIDLLLACSGHEAAGTEGDDAAGLGAEIGVNTESCVDVGEHGL